MSILPKRVTIPLAAIRKGDEVTYYAGKLKVSKELHDKLSACDTYEDLRKAGFDGDDVVELGRKCGEAQDEFVMESMRQRPESKKTAPKKARAAKKPAAKKAVAKKPAEKKERTKVKCGTDKNKRPYFYVNGKRATKDAYLAAGGRCKAAKK